jgi:Tol biopolymer transport system component
VDKAQENAVLALTTQAGGAFSGGVETHTLRLANNGDTLLYSLPSGRTQNSAFWYQIPLDDIRTPQPLLELHSMTLDYNAGVDAAPAASPDGRWLAFVIRDGNSSSIQLLDLENPAELPDPILATRNQGEAIQWLAFTPDSGAVVFIAGQSELRGNALYRAEVGQSTATTITAGTFSAWAIISPRREEIAVLEWQPTPADRPAIDPYLNLVLVDLEDGAREVLLDGLVIDASDDASLQFALPLWWGE